MSSQSSHQGMHIILIGLTYIVVFIAGLYMGKGTPYTQLPQEHSDDNIILTRNTETNLVNVSKEVSFFDIGTQYNTDKVTVHRYHTLYEKYIRKYIGSNVILLEIGLGCDMRYGPGASAYLWRNYLGPRARIHFIEYDQKCAKEWHETHGKKLNITMHYGNQEDVEFLNTVNSEQDYFDIIIDDGGHSMKQQITSFTYLLGKVRSGGIYVIEDLETSYSSFPGSGYLVNTTTIELIKRLVDDVQEGSPRKVTGLGDKIFSFELSNQICFFNKK